MLAKSGGSKRRVGKLGGHTPATGAGTEPSMPSQDEAKRVKAAEEERPHPAATTGGASPDKAPAEAGAEGNDAVGRHQGGAEQHNQMPADSARLQESGPVPDSGKDAFETFALGSSGRVSQGALSAEALTGDSSVALDGAPSSGQYVQAALQALLTPEPEQPPKAGLQASRHLKLVQTGCPDTPAWYCLVPLLGLEASGSQEVGFPACCSLWDVKLQLLSCRNTHTCSVHASLLSHMQRWHQDALQFKFSFCQSCFFGAHGSLQ